MYLTLFAIIGMEIGADSFYWWTLGVSAALKLIKITLSWLEGRTTNENL